MHNVFGALKALEDIRNKTRTRRRASQPRQSPGNSPCSSRQPHEKRENCSIPICSLSRLSETNPSMPSSGIASSRQAGREGMLHSQRSPSTPLCNITSNRLKVFTSSSWMLPPNVLQARSKTWRQATQPSTSAMLKCTLMPKNQHVTNCQITVSSSPFPLSLKTQLISYRGKRHYTRPSPTSGMTSLLQEVSPRQRRSPGEVNRYSCLSHTAKSTVLISQLLQPPPNPTLTACAT